MKRILEIKNFKLFGCMLAVLAPLEMISSIVSIVSGYTRYSTFGFYLATHLVTFIMTLVCGLIYIIGMELLALFFMTYKGKMWLPLPLGLLLIGSTPLIYGAFTKEYGIYTTVAIIAYILLSVFAFIGEKMRKASIITIVGVFTVCLVLIKLYLLIVRLISTGADPMNSINAGITLVSSGFSYPVGGTGYMLLIGLLIFYLSKPAPRADDALNSRRLNQSAY